MPLLMCLWCARLFWCRMTLPTLGSTIAGYAGLGSLKKQLNKLKDSNPVRNIHPWSFLYLLLCDCSFYAPVPTSVCDRCWPEK